MRVKQCKAERAEKARFARALAWLVWRSSLPWRSTLAALAAMAALALDPGRPGLELKPATLATWLAGLAELVLKPGDLDELATCRRSVGDR